MLLEFLLCASDLLPFSVALLLHMRDALGNHQTLLYDVASATGIKRTPVGMFQKQAFCLPDFVDSFFVLYNRNWIFSF